MAFKQNPRRPASGCLMTRPSSKPSLFVVKNATEELLLKVGKQVNASMKEEVVETPEEQT